MASCALGGCAASQAVTAGAAEFVPEVPWQDSAGSLVPRERAEAQLMAAAVVYVGEFHAEPRSMATQLEVVQALLDGGREVVLGVEWLPQSATEAVADYMEGSLPEAELLEEVSWARAWGFPFEAYRPLFELARDRGVPLVGLNAPLGLARRLGRSGLDGLEYQDRERLTDLDSGNEAHRSYFAAKMRAVASAHGGHGHGHGPPVSWEPGGEIYERYYLAQLLRDEAMAREVSALVGEGRTVVVLAGLGHVEHALGIPERVSLPQGGNHVIIETWRRDQPICGNGAAFPAPRCDLRYWPGLARPQVPRTLDQVSGR